jgi:hypothetical protein
LGAAVLHPAAAAAERLLAVAGLTPQTEAVVVDLLTAAVEAKASRMVEAAAAAVKVVEVRAAVGIDRETARNWNKE